MRLLLASSIAVSICAAGALAQTSSSVATRQVGTATLENVPEVPADVAAAVQRYQNYRAASFQDWLSDGSILIATRFGSTQQIHRVTTPGGARTQITFQSEAVAAARAIPGTQRFVYQRDTGGDEWFQLYATGLTGDPLQLTEAGTRNQGAAFSPDGKMLAWSRATKGSAEYAIYVADPSDARSAKSVYRETGLDRSRRHLRGSNEGAVHARHLQSGIEAVHARPRLRQGDADCAEGQQGSVPERASVARRSQRLCDLHEGQRLRSARADRHRQRQGHRADDGSEMGRRHVRDVRRRSSARVRRERGRVLERRRARHGHASRSAAAAAASRRVAEHRVLAGQEQARIRSLDRNLRGRRVDLGSHRRQSHALDDFGARRTRSCEARRAAVDSLQVLRRPVRSRARLSSGRRCRRTSARR